MNDARRKEIEMLQGILSGIMTEIVRIWDEEQEEFYKLPRSVQLSKEGLKMEESIEDLNTVSVDLDEAILFLGSAIK